MATTPAAAVRVFGVTRRAPRRALTRGVATGSITSTVHQQSRPLTVTLAGLSPRAVGRRVPIVPTASRGELTAPAQDASASPPSTPVDERGTALAHVPERLV